MCYREGIFDGHRGISFDMAIRVVAMVMFPTLYLLRAT
jgi:hypothetical protein